MRLFLLSYLFSATGLAIAHPKLDAHVLQSIEGSSHIGKRSPDGKLRMILPRSDSGRSSGTRALPMLRSDSSSPPPSPSPPRSPGIKRASSTRSDAVSPRGGARQQPDRRGPARNNRLAPQRRIAAARQGTSPEPQQLGSPQRELGSPRRSGSHLRLASPGIQTNDLGHPEAIPRVFEVASRSSTPSPPWDRSPHTRTSPGGSALPRQNSNMAMYNSWNSFREDSPPPIGLKAPRISAEDLRNAGFEPSGPGFSSREASPASPPPLRRAGSAFPLPPSPPQSSTPLRHMIGQSSGGSPNFAAQRPPRGSPRPRMSPTASSAMAQLRDMELRSPSESPRAPPTVFEQ